MINCKVYLQTLLIYTVSYCTAFYTNPLQGRSIMAVLFRGQTSRVQNGKGITDLSSILGKHLLKSLRVGTHQLVNLLTTLEDKESWHGANAELTSQFRQLIHIKLDEINALGERRFLGEPEFRISLRLLKDILS